MRAALRGGSFFVTDPTSRKEDECMRTKILVAACVALTLFLPSHASAEPRDEWTETPGHIRGEWQPVAFYLAKVDLIAELDYAQALADDAAADAARAAAAISAPSRTNSTGGGAGGNFAAIRACESGGNYATNTGNGYYGAYQFDIGTWQSVGGSGLPSDASPAEQDHRAAILYSQRGGSPWPNCG